MAGHETHDPLNSPIEGCPKCDAVIDRPRQRSFGEGISSQVVPGRKAYEISRLKEVEAAAVKEALFLDASLTVEEAILKIAEGAPLG